MWLCRCTCGNTILVRGGHLRIGKITSCGCQNRDKILKWARAMNPKPKPTKHEEINTTLYSIWINIKKRCYTKSNSAYKYYGKRGIVMCNQWKDNYLSFKKWAFNHGYKEGLTIDRIDSNGDYEPPNCQWITKSENSRKNANNCPRDQYGRFKKRRGYPKNIKFGYSVSDSTKTDDITSPSSIFTHYVGKI